MLVVGRKGATLIIEARDGKYFSRNVSHTKKTKKPSVSCAGLDDSDEDVMPEPKQPQFGFPEQGENTGQPPTRRNPQQARRRQARILD